MFGEHFVDAPGAEPAFGRGEQTRHLQPVAAAEAVDAGVDDSVVAVDQTRVRVGLHLLVELDDFLSDRNLGVFQRRDRVEQVPQRIVTAGEHPAAAGDIGARNGGGLRPVERPAAEAEFFEDVDVGARHAGVANEEHGRRHRGDAAADQPDLALLGIEMALRSHRLSP